MTLLEVKISKIIDAVQNSVINVIEPLVMIMH